MYFDGSMKPEYRRKIRQPLSTGGEAVEIERRNAKEYKEPRTLTVVQLLLTHHGREIVSSIGYV